jgi:hypothetical protein
MEINMPKKTPDLLERSCKAMTERIIERHCQRFMKKWQTQEKKKQEQQFTDPKCVRQKK